MINNTSRLVIFQALTFCCLVLSCKKAPQKDNLDFRDFSTDSTLTSTFKLIEMSNDVENNIKNWTLLNLLKESINDIRNTTQKKNINNTYQTLYYKICGLYENINSLERSPFLPHLESTSVHSRATLIKTYVLRLKSQMETNKMLSSGDIIENLKDIFDSYNSFLSEIGREYNKKVNSDTIGKYFLKTDNLNNTLN